MTRFLFWVALALLIYFAVRSKIKQGQKRQPPPQPQRQAPPTALPVEAMLQCAHCGVHFPASENVPAGGRNYCSPAHAPTA